MKIRDFFCVGCLVVVSSFLSGCAGGRNYDYSRVPIDSKLVVVDHRNIALAVHDQRPYVKNGDKYPQYVGTQRSAAYVPWNINTKSGLPMADDFLMSIKRALDADGYIVNCVVLSANEDKDAALKKLLSTGAERALLFTIKEWLFDVWTSTRMEYDLQLDVYNQEGSLLATASVRKSMWDSSQNAIPDLEYKFAVEKLLNDDKIAQAINIDNVQSVRMGASQAEQ